MPDMLYLVAKFPLGYRALAAGLDGFFQREVPLLGGRILAIERLLLITCKGRCECTAKLANAG